MTEGITGIQKRVLDVFPSGIANGEFGLPPEQLITVERGDGCRLWDNEGEEYLDFSMGWGSCLVGHARPEVVEAVRKQATSGFNFAFATPPALELAEEIKATCPAVEQLRFCASGTEANMYCQRLARAFTNKPKLLKFEGAYHGANEPGVTSLFSRRLLDFPEPEPTSAGIPSVRNDMLIAPYNDLETTSAVLAEHHHEVAAIIMEPLQRCTPPREGFLLGIRQLCDRYNLLLVFDEVVTGFRLAYGGAQEYYGVIPDLVAYGKALGGGSPIGVFGGRIDIMNWVCEQRIDGDDYVWMASTLGGNPISMAAANATLSVFRRPGTYEHLHALGDYLRAGIRQVLDDRAITAQVIGDGPVAQIIFSDSPVFDYRSTCKGDSNFSRLLMLELFRRRVFLNPMGTKLYLSIAHDEACCDEFCNRLDDALKLLLKTYSFEKYHVRNYP